jgi:hypothetical protein
MVGAGPAISLSDVIFTIRGTTGGDDGNPVRTPAGTGAITVKFDRISFVSTEAIDDHASGQDVVDFMRGHRVSQTLTVETKLQKKAAAELADLLFSEDGVVLIFTATATGCSIGTQTTPSVGGARVESKEFDYAGPSTLRFTLRNYGTPFYVSNA